MYLQLQLSGAYALGQGPARKAYALDFDGLGSAPVSLSTFSFAMSLILSREFLRQICHDELLHLQEIAFQTML